MFFNFKIDYYWKLSSIDWEPPDTSSYAISNS